MEDSVIVNLVNVGKKYGDKQLFRGVNKIIEPGHCLAITGPNGSGKSTLLKMIAGLSQPSSGVIRITCGYCTLNQEESKGYMGMVSPEIQLYSAMTGIENIVFLARCRGVECSPAFAHEACITVGLEDYGDTLLSTYSTGMKQRLKFAIMLAVKPALWLLDEPSSNLDAGGKRLVETMISKALKRMATVIIATNEWWESEYASKKISLGE